MKLSDVPRLLVFATLLFSLPTMAQVRLTEFMASNTHTLADEDGSFEDWIEIHNFSSTNVNLYGWSLTDSVSKLNKWTFPAVNLPSGDFLIVFASNKDRRTVGQPLHTNFKLDASGEYLALVDPTGTNIVTQFSPTYPPQVADVSFGFALTTSNVTLVATGAVANVLVPSLANGGSALNFSWTGAPTNEPFILSSWTNGPTGVGFGTPTNIGLNIQSSMSNNNASAFIRFQFNVSNPTNFSLLTLRLKYDDGFVAWLNGNELARAQAPGEDLNWDSTATAAHSASVWESISVGAGPYLQAGTNVLAIQGLNLSANNASFLILPELLAATYAVESTNGFYFTQPSPGADNFGGSLVPGPGIGKVIHTPNVPLDNDNLVVTAKVFATANPLAGVVLHYRVMFNSETALPMFDDGLHGDGAAGDGIFGATIPADTSTNGQMVRYYITAQDTSNVVSRLPVFTDPAGTAEYFGTVVNPDYVTSALPVIHIFAPESVLQPGPTTTKSGADSDAGGRVSLFFDGEFYDNVQMQLRGNTTGGLNKKSHRIEFNREHPFRYSSSTRRIRKTSFLADYVDPSYLRGGLSFWLGELTGASTPFMSPFRLQRNGVFYELANHTDIEGEEMLERLGFDPNGAFYANVGTVRANFESTGGFEKKTRKAPVGSPEDYSDYLSLANAIVETLPLGQRTTNVFDRFDLPNVISYLVTARFTHQNDDVWANMALYHDNDGDDLWRVIAYDQNLSYGAAYMDSSSYSGIQSTNDDLKSFPLYGSSAAIATGASKWNRLYDVVFQSPLLREMFLRRLRTVLDAYVKPPGTPLANLPIEQKAIAWRNLIGPDAQLDRAFWGWPSKGGQCNFDPGILVTNGVDDLINVFMTNRRNHFYGRHSITNLALPVGISKTSNAGIPLAQPTNAALSIIAWDYNPASGNQDEEFIQLTNANSFAVDVSGWELDGGIHFKFKGGTVVPANSSVYLSPNLKAFRLRALSPHGGEGRFVVGPYSGHLNAWGESLALTDTVKRLVSSNSFAGNPSPAQRCLRITEIMYNPSPAPAITNDAQQFEYVELKNISTNVTLNLNGVRFTNGIFFNFTGSAVTSLAPGQTVLLVRNQTAFAARYGGGLNIAGQFTGALDNGGETLRLEDAVSEKILEFAYNDSWYPITDGLGFSLVIVDETAPWDSWDKKISWRASANVNGSPSAADPAPAQFNPIVINEVLTHTDLPQVDSVELFNPTTNVVNIGGWLLTDDFFTPKKYRIPNGTTMAAGGYLLITENQFNTGANAFRLSELGEDIYLFSANATTNLTGYYQGYTFPAAPNGVSFGRYLNSQGEVHFILQSALTLGASNAYPRVGPVVISEIMYHPPDTNGVDNDLDEFIELQNITSTNVPLYDVNATTNTWRLRNAVDFDFPMNQSLSADARCLILGFDPTNTPQLAAFRAKYGVSNNVAVYGPWSGKLDNSGETIELKQPGAPDDTLIAPYYMTDKIDYTDAAPWPMGADGIGNSLQRRSNTGYGNDPTNWLAAGATAGRATVPNLAPTVSITSPTNGAIIYSTNSLIISVSANDSDGSVALVQLFGDGSELARWAIGSSNYLWTSASAGLHQVQARVTDNLGTIAESPAISVSVVRSPPVVSVLSPTNGQVLLGGSTVALSASATSGGGPAAQVDYYLDGSLITSAGSPFSASWVANPPGYHTLAAIAVDAFGQASAPVSIPVFIQASANYALTLVPSGSSGWKYFDDGANPGAGWASPGFNAGAWSNGVAQLGFGDGDEATVVRKINSSGATNVTIYFRKEFVVPPLASMSGLSLSVLRDDGIVAYLNGTEVFRDNMPAGTISYQTFASTTVSGSGESTFFSANLNPAVLVSGTNLLAIEVHQDRLASSDISMDAQLILQGTRIGPAFVVQPASQSAIQNSNVTFSVTVTGTDPLAYRWYFGNTSLSVTSNILTLTNVQSAAAGSYYLIASNVVGVVTSFVAALTIVPADSDGDGLPDDWEQVNGTNPLVNDRDADPDHDGQSNFQEYLAGTNPTNAASVLKFENVSVSSGQLLLNFNAVSNHSYSVQQQPGLGNGAWQKWQDILAATSNRTIWLTNSLGNSNGFYRLTTPMQP